MAKAALAVADGDDQTLARARGGDQAAFALIVARHQAMVFSLALHALGNRPAAEDLAQEVFVEFYRSLARIESAAHAEAWLRRVTSHRCIDELRRPRHRRELRADALPDRGEPPPQREPFLEARLLALVAGLPPPARLVIVLRYQEDLDPSEIAATLNMPLNTVKSHLRRSIATLRAAMLEVRLPPAPELTQTNAPVRLKPDTANPVPVKPDIANAIRRTPDTTGGPREPDTASNGRPKPDAAMAVRLESDSKGTA